MDKARQRALSRDQQIRKTAGLAISKQSRPRTNSTRPRKEEASPNAVANYELCEAETILESNTIVEAARHMAAKRLDFVLVVDGMGRLVGIVTDKDLAFRVIAEGLDPRQTAVAQVMTREPQCVQSSVSMIDALTKMVQNHFRHLPVMEEERIIGVLDIAKCLYDALQKLELADAAANQIAAALETVGKEFGGNSKRHPGDNKALNYADTIRDCLASPKLSSILSQTNGAQCAIVNVKCSVAQAVRQMKERLETALLVTEEPAGLVGIFTTKDVLLRVVAAGLDPSTTSIVRVMTPHPDSATLDVSIVAALRQMHGGHYLHLPVLRTTHEKTILGVVDVLQLTYSMLEQLSALKGSNEAPLWHQLWSPNDVEGELERRSNSSSNRDMASRSERGQIAYAPQPPSSILDEFTHVPSSILFKIKHNDAAILVPTDSATQLPSIVDLETEARARFKVSGGNLFLLDDEEDLIPVRDDGELNKFVQMIAATGRDRINLVLLDRNAIADGLRGREARYIPIVALISAGFVIAGLTAVAFMLKSQKP
jgi:CBS domain-containing protein